jgi:hypothetical protein
MINTGMKFDDLVQRLMETHDESNDITIKVIDMKLDLKHGEIEDSECYPGYADIEATHQGKTYSLVIIVDQNGELDMSLGNHLQQDHMPLWMIGDTLLDHITQQVDTIFTKKFYKNTFYKQQMLPYLQDSDDLGLSELDL